LLLPSRLGQLLRPLRSTLGLNGPEWRCRFNSRFRDLARHFLNQWGRRTLLLRRLYWPFSGRPPALGALLYPPPYLLLYLPRAPLCFAVVFLDHWRRRLVFRLLPPKHQRVQPPQHEEDQPDHVLVDLERQGSD